MVVISLLKILETVLNAIKTYDYNNNTLYYIHSEYYNKQEMLKRLHRKWEGSRYESHTIT